MTETSHIKIRVTPSKVVCIENVPTVRLDGVLCITLENGIRAERIACLHALLYGDYDTHILQFCKRVLRLSEQEFAIALDLPETDIYSQKAVKPAIQFFLALLSGYKPQQSHVVF